MNYTARNLIIAMALALVGIVLTSSYIGSQKEKLVKGKEHVTVLVAKKDVPAGTKVSELKSGGFLEETSVLRDDAAPGVLDMEDLKGMNKLATSSTIFVGQQVTKNEIDPVSKLSPADAIRGTERQISVAIGQVEGGAYLIKANDRIDLWASDDEKTWIVARNVLVLKTPKDMLPPDGELDPAKPNGDPQIFVLKASDAVTQNIFWAISHSDEHHLYAALRPSVGGQETKLKNQTGPAKVS